MTPWRSTNGWSQPIYTKRMQRLLGFEETPSSGSQGMQLDIGAPPEFMIPHAVQDDHHGTSPRPLRALMTSNHGDDFVSRCATTLKIHLRCTLATNPNCGSAVPAPAYQPIDADCA